ncbi:DUF1643 domain-containing protein [Neobacillus soli]|uniref:DUF1643 domain-containing protein n=1 Tax=Neobacillus soli TaxID=220688 RepID=UPI0008267A91|nr:DUF1643 domain-containing protein [Neobacillus soli]
MSKAKRYYNLIHVEPEGYLPKKGSHRFGLKFQSKSHRNGKSAAVIQMNGSMAGPTEKKNKWKCDSTIGKVLSWCYENPANPIDIVHCLNLFSYVDPHPKNLSGMNEKALNSVKNDNWIKTICKDVDYIILAHGNCKGIDKVIVDKRIKQVLKWLEKYDLYRVGELTNKGNPKHGRSWNNSPVLTLHREKVDIIEYIS